MKTQQEALEEVKIKIEEDKATTWMMLKSITRANPTYLRAMGYSNMTNAEAALKCFKNALARQEKWLVEFEKQYPA